MQEYVTEALILTKEPLRDFDGRYIFLTKRFGKLVGKATSSRKITSKLAGHLEPGTLAQVRFVDRSHGGSTQIADALKYGVVAANTKDLHALGAMLIEGEKDEALWEAATAARFSWRDILRILGWDPNEARCERCSVPATSFYIPRQSFFCNPCASKAVRDTLLLIVYGEQRRSAESAF